MEKFRRKTQVEVRLQRTISTLTTHLRVHVNENVVESIWIVYDPSVC
jgi:hypothetical protein